MIEIGVHKQLANRLLEPFLWHTVVVTATEWSNFFNLRCHPDAHPAIRKVAENMRMALVESTPKKLGEQDWHLPFIRDEDIDGNSVATLKKVSAGRCARVSYLTHEGKRDLEADVALHDRLLASGHLSPFEHQARPMDDREKAMGWFASNFQGWVQYRKTISYESDIKNPNNGQPIPTIHVG
jgi:thymidylate synthase ThyX